MSSVTNNPNVALDQGQLFNFDNDIGTFEALLARFEKQAATNPPSDAQDLLQNYSWFINALTGTPNNPGLLGKLQADDQALQAAAGSDTIDARKIASSDYGVLELFLTSAQGSGGEYESLYQIADDETGVQNQGDQNTVNTNLANALINAYQSGELTGDFAASLKAFRGK